MLNSESRRPGMVRQQRHCEICDAVLGVDDSDRCADCAPRLSNEALTAQLKKERLRADLAAIKRVEALASTVEVAVRRMLKCPR